MYCILQVYRGGAGLPHLAPALDGALPEGGLAAGPSQHQHGCAVQVNSTVQYSTVQYSTVISIISISPKLVVRSVCWIMDTDPT